MYNTKIDETKIDRLANLAVNTGLSLLLLKHYH